MRLATAAVFLGGVVAAAAPARATTAPSPQLAPAMEQCIRSNAEKVERAIPDLYEAVNFLVNGVCSEPLDQEYQRVLDLQEQKSRAALFEMCDQEKREKTEPGSTETHQLQNPLCTSVGMRAMTDPASRGQDIRAFGTPPHSAAATSLAAQLLLDLRLARQNSKSQ